MAPYSQSSSSVQLRADARRFPPSISIAATPLLCPSLLISPIDCRVSGLVGGGLIREEWQYQRLSILLQYPVSPAWVMSSSPPPPPEVKKQKSVPEDLKRPSEERGPTMDLERRPTEDEVVRPHHVSFPLASR